MKKILVINGPNLNFLGIREKNIYGDRDYNYLVGMIEEYANTKEIEVECFQSNHEGAIIDKIQEAYFENVATFPKIEVHISDVNSREKFRHVSVTEPACTAQIIGKGFDGYLMAIDMILSE